MGEGALSIRRHPRCWRGGSEGSGRGEESRQYRVVPARRAPPLGSRSAGKGLGQAGGAPAGVVLGSGLCSGRG